MGVLWYKNMFGLIYKATNIQNKKVYIGQTVKSLKRRKQRHYNNALHSDKLIFYRAIRKYGHHNFKWEILGYCETKQELNEAEIECIAFFQSVDTKYGYNMAKGGKKGIDWTGKHHSKESCEKISKSKIGKVSGENNPFYGKQHTKEFKEKQRKNRKGKKRLLISRQKQGESQKKEKNAFWGKKHSEESKIKISQARKRQNLEKLVIEFIF